MSNEKDQFERMDESLIPLVQNMTQFQKRYCEYRARGHKQADASKKAGSSASDRGALGRVGWNTEQVEGVKEYIDFLIKEFAQDACVSPTEIINKLRAVYDEAMMNGKYAEANKATELMGNMINVFDKHKGAGSARDGEKGSSNSSGPKNNVGAFIDPHDRTAKEKLRELTSLANAGNTQKDLVKKGKHHTTKKPKE